MELSFGWVLIIILVLAYASMVSFFWVIIPRWSFIISTDKTVFVAGETVDMTVCLKNVGCLSQSLTTSIADLVFVWIKMDIWVETGSGGMKRVQTIAWRSPFNIEESMFTVASGQSLMKTILWDQSWYAGWNRTGFPGRYYVSAVVPESHVICALGFDRRIGGQT